jgi:hypothetical protein
MRRRTRRSPFKKQTISQEEYDRISEQSSAAQELLDDERFSFWREYLRNKRDSIAQLILENSITEVKEVVTFSDKLKRIFTTPKKVQVDELVGQYKLVGELLDDLQQTASLKEEVDQALARKAIVLAEDDEV